MADAGVQVITRTLIGPDERVQHGLTNHHAACTSLGAQLVVGELSVVMSDADVIDYVYKTSDLAYDGRTKDVRVGRMGRGR